MSSTADWIRLTQQVGAPRDVPTPLSELAAPAVLVNMANVNLITDTGSGSELAFMGGGTLDVEQHLVTIEHLLGRKSRP